MSEVSLKLDLLALSAGLYTKCTVHHVSCWFIHQVLVLIFPLIPATYLQCLLYMLAFRPAVQATQSYHGEHFDPVSTSGVCLPHLSFVTVFVPFTPPSFHSIGTLPPLLREMTVPSPFLSLRFIHPLCLAPAVSSPPTLTPTP
ncbi:hypothetical protein AMECASPLE_009593 [Ameca splendens]|uniref:Uncharacterized protein n=1 Tax=Ameca splendens TaxID=208324 RepID=A0ABV0YY62_9TELE